MKKTYRGTPLSAEYWRFARDELKNPRMLAFAALMIAACTALTLIPSIPTTDPNVRVTWGFLARAVCGMVCGPVVALVFGAAEDTINFLLAPSGPYFPGYTLTTMIGTFLYAIFLYRMKKPTAPQLLLRTFLAKLSTNILNVVLSSLWSAILYGKGYLYYMVKSFWKNLVMLPVQTAMLFFLLLALLPILRRMGLMPQYRAEAAQAPAQPEAPKQPAKPRAEVIAMGVQPAAPRPVKVFPIQQTAAVEPDAPATVIAAGATFLGDLRVPGDVEVWGRVKGNVEATGSVLVKGQVLGDVKGESIRLRGCTVQGNVTGSSVTMDADATVMGDVQAAVLSCGGRIKGDLNIAGMASLTSGAVLAGSVTAATVAVAQGAKVRGSIRMRAEVGSDNPFAALDI